MTVTVKFLPILVSFGIGWLVAGWKGAILAVVFLFAGVFLALWDLTDGGRKL